MEGRFNIQNLNVSRLAGPGHHLIDDSNQFRHLLLNIMSYRDAKRVVRPLRLYCSLVHSTGISWNLHGLFIYIYIYIYMKLWRYGAAIINRGT
jgi:hypothetical protein